MKLLKRGKKAGPVDPPTELFLRGFIATGLLATLQDRCAAGPPRPLDLRKALRHAVQGGVALTAGVTAANALARRNYGMALAAAATGAAGVLAAEILLQPAVPTDDQTEMLEENDLGQELAQEG